MEAQESTEIVRVSTWHLMKLFFVNPRRAFLELADTPRFAVPFFLLLLGRVVQVHWYFSAVDIDWLKQQLVPAITRPDSQQRAHHLAMITRNTLDVSSCLSAVVISGLVVLGCTLYLYVMGKILQSEDSQHSFGQWFAFSSWSNLPQILGLIPQYIAMGLLDLTHEDVNSLNPLSLNTLFELGPADPAYRLLSNLTLLTFAQLVFAAVGLQVWYKKSFSVSLAVAAAPALVLYGAWALYVF
jgi:hypothetical protein